MSDDDTRKRCINFATVHRLKAVEEDGNGKVHLFNPDNGWLECFDGWEQCHAFFLAEAKQNAQGGIVRWHLNSRTPDGAITTPQFVDALVRYMRGCNFPRMQIEARRTLYDPEAEFDVQELFAFDTAFDLLWTLRPMIEEDLRYEDMTPELRDRCTALIAELAEADYKEQQADRKARRKAKRLIAAKRKEDALQAKLSPDKAAARRSRSYV
jgi:hypothetical protein